MNGFWGLLKFTIWNFVKFDWDSTSNSSLCWGLLNLTTSAFSTHSEFPGILTCYLVHTLWVDRSLQWVEFILNICDIKVCTPRFLFSFHLEVKHFTFKLSTIPCTNSNQIHDCVDKLLGQRERNKLNMTSIAAIITNKLHKDTTWDHLHTYMYCKPSFVRGVLI